MKVAHLNLDLSQITIDTTILTPGGEDTVNDETVDSTHTVEQEVETNSVVIAQSTLGGLDGPPA